MNKNEQRSIWDNVVQFCLNVRQLEVIIYQLRWEHSLNSNWYNWWRCTVWINRPGQETWEEKGFTSSSPFSAFFTALFISLFWIWESANPVVSWADKQLYIVSLSLKQAALKVKWNDETSGNCSEADSVEDFVQRGSDARQTASREKWQLRLQQWCFKEESFDLYVDVKPSGWRGTLTRFWWQYSLQSQDFNGSAPVMAMAYPPYDCAWPEGNVSQTTSESTLSLSEL